MKQTAKAYICYFLLYFKTIQQYKFNWVMSLFKVPFTLVLYWYLWKALFSHGEIFNDFMNFNSMFLYFMLIQWITLCLSYPAGDKIANDILMGGFSIALARPVYYLPTQFCAFFAHFCFGFCIGIIPVFFMLDNAKLTYSMIGIEIVFFMNAAIIFFLVECCIAVSGFWLTRIFGIKMLLVTFLNLAGGRIIPLNLFPEWLQNVSFLSPYRAIFFEPAFYFQSHHASDGLLLQVAWIFFLSLFLNKIWLLGCERSEANL